MGTTINKNDTIVERSQADTQKAADGAKANAIGAASSSFSGLGGATKGATTTPPTTPPPTTEKAPPPPHSGPAGSTNTPPP